MDFSLTDEQRALAELTGEMLTQESTLERLKALEEGNERIDRELWKKLAQAELLGTAIPEEHGGAGLGLVELCLMLEQVGRAVAHVPLLPTLVYGALPIAEFGSAEQKARLLPPVARGESFLTAALAEVGTDARHVTTTARASGDGFRVDGVKIAVPIAAQADVVIVPARLDGGGVVVLLVDPRAKGVQLDRQETTNWEGHYRMALDGVVVPRSAVLGTPERGSEILGWILDRATAGLCAIASGVCESALRITAEYATNRKQFEKPIATFQAVSQRLADGYIGNEALNLSMWQVATRLADGMPSDKEVATAKYWACEAGNHIGHAALHIHGGISIDVDYPIQRYFLWAKQIECTLGASTPSLIRLGSLIAAEPA